VSILLALNKIRASAPYIKKKAMKNKGEYNNLCTVDVVHSGKIKDGFI
jgi:hypothetical protein